MASILRSYQVYGADDQVLTAAVEAVKKACKDAKSQSKVQRVALHRRGYRQDIEVGDVFVVPTSVCNDPEDFPTILLSANLRQHTTGEGMVEFQMGALVEPGELSRDSLQEFKKVVFINSKGDASPLVVFAPAWAHPSAYQSFVYEEDNLLDRLREVAYAAPFNPSLSAVFDQLRACDPDAAPAARVLPITQHIYKIAPSEEKDYPEFAKGLEIADEEGGKKKASLERRPVIRLRASDIPELERASLSDEELAAFDAVQNEVQKALKKGSETTPASEFAPQAGSTTEPSTVADASVPTVEVTSLDTTQALPPGEQPGTYVEPPQDTRKPGENLELGEEGNVSDRTPDLVDGPDPKTAAANPNDVRMVMEIPSGGKKVFNVGGFTFTVYYDEQVAQADSGAQVPGMISGDYEVWVGQEPDLRNLLRQHVSPGKPKGMQQSYAAEKVVDAIMRYVSGRRAGGHYAYKVDGGVVCAGCASKKGITAGGIAQSHLDVQNKTCKDCGKTLGHAAKGFKDVKEVTAASAEGPWYVIDEGTGKPHSKHKNRGEATKVYNKLNKDRFEGKEGAPSYSMHHAESWDQDHKTASMALDTVAACRKFIENWGGQTLDGATLKKELSKITDKLRDAVIFMRDEGSLVPEGDDHYKVLGADLMAQAANPPKLSFVLRNAKTKQVWAAAMVDGVPFGGEWTDDRSQATRFAFRGTALGEIRRHRIASEAVIVAKSCDCGGDCECCQNKKTSSWWNPGSVIEQFYPELQHGEVGSPFMSQEQGEVINPFGAPGKSVAQDPNAMGLSQGLDENAGGTPLRTENNFYGPEYARNFYAPHTDIPGKALTLKKVPRAAAEKSAMPKETPKVDEDKAPWMKTDSRNDEEILGNTKKKAAPALSLFQGLELAPEEHPQAHFDEAAPTPEQGAYNEPVKEDAVPQDDTFVAVDKLLKGVVAAYAAQLIAAFQVTNKPLAMGTPFKDKLDLHQTLEQAGGGNANVAQADAAKAQFNQAMSNLSDDQKQMLVKNAFAQAAVWCNNPDGSGGFNYEVFVRAESLNGPTLEVVVVTGAK